MEGTNGGALNNQHSEIRWEIVPPRGATYLEIQFMEFSTERYHDFVRCASWLFISLANLVTSCLQKKKYRSGFMKTATDQVLCWECSMVDRGR